MDNDIMITVKKMVDGNTTDKKDNTEHHNQWMLYQKTILSLWKFNCIQILDVW